MTALYIHIPWCVRKCPYCDFNSHEPAGEIPQSQYVAALIADLDSDIAEFGARPVTSIFIGGGTPSLFSSRALGDLLGETARRVPIESGAEITLEANPGTVEGVSRFEDFRRAGINRLSLGIQSFEDRALAALGRIHDARQALRAFERARHAGFENINVDLMHGLPDQDRVTALADLEQAVALAPEHVSWYQLTVEPNTVFYKRPPTLPDEDTLWDIFEQGMARLEDAGFRRYEVSAFARDGARSTHNLNYWRFGDYYGIGAGAHGKLTVDGGVVRTTKTRLPGDYLADPKRKVDGIVPAELPLEFLMNALRLVDGFEPALYEARTGRPFTELTSFLDRARRKGLLEQSATCIAPTTLGLLYLNDLLMLLDDATIARST